MMVCMLVPFGSLSVGSVPPRPPQPKLQLPLLTRNASVIPRSPADCALATTPSPLPVKLWSLYGAKSRAPGGRGVGVGVGLGVGVGFGVGVGVGVGPPPVQETGRPQGSPVPGAPLLPGIVGF